jgi:Flp pilus assembly protein TadG
MGQNGWTGAMDGMQRIVGAFLRDRRGNVAIIVALLLMPMLVLAGGATDIARYEAHRAQL